MKLEEGVNALKRNFIKSLNSRKDINIGIEYEYHPVFGDISDYQVIDGDYEKEDDIDELFKLVQDYDLYVFPNSFASDLAENSYIKITDTAELTAHLQETEMVHYIYSEEEIIAEFNALVKLQKYLTEVDIEELDIDNLSEVKSLISDFNIDTDYEPTDSGFAFLYVTAYEYNTIDQDATMWGTVVEHISDGDIRDIFSCDLEDEDSVDYALRCLYTIGENIAGDKTKLRNIDFWEEVELTDVSIYHPSTREVLLYEHQINDWMYYNVDIVQADASNPHHIKFLADEGIYDLSSVLDDMVNYEVPSDLDNRDIEYDKVSQDNDYQVEVITDIMTYTETVDHLEQMFEFIKENGSTSDKSGMHVSISSHNWESTPFNFLKFFVLMNIPNILEDFEERTHVADLYRLFMDNRKVFEVIQKHLIKKVSLSNVVSLILNELEKESTNIMKGKQQSIKFDDYNISNGRIELRYFGGTDYEYRYDEIITHIHKATYLMDLSYGDTFDKEYKKNFIKLLDAHAKTSVWRYINDLHDSSIANKKLSFSEIYELYQAKFNGKEIKNLKLRKDRG